MLIHLCQYSSQPYVMLCCTRQHHYVGCQPPGMPNGIHMADPANDGDPPPLYTFDETKATCPKCLDHETA